MNASRMGIIGGSDARRIIEGDWLALYEEKVGIRQPEDLSGVFRVQLGVHTERFHLLWLSRWKNMAISDGRIIANPSRPWMQGSFDGLVDGTFIELKHSNARATVRSMSEEYQPQIAHYCAVLGVSYGYLSFIAGNEEPVVCKVQPSQTYIDELVALETSFWWHLENKVAPDAPMHAEGFAEVHAQAKNIKVDGMRFVDMHGNNQWADLARTIIDTKAAADQHEAARNQIKELVEKDVAEADGHGITIKRDKRGALRFTIGKEN